jgi:hypothetical protein
MSTDDKTPAERPKTPPAPQRPEPPIPPAEFIAMVRQIRADLDDVRGVWRPEATKKLEALDKQLTEIGAKLEELSTTAAKADEIAKLAARVTELETSHADVSTAVGFHADTLTAVNAMIEEIAAGPATKRNPADRVLPKATEIKIDPSKVGAQIAKLPSGQEVTINVRRPDVGTVRDGQPQGVTPGKVRRS